MSSVINATSLSGSSPKHPARIALLTNIIGPYRIPVFLELTHKLAAFRIFISALTEPDRTWKTDLAGLEVHLQRTITRTRVARDPRGFTDTLYTHFPLDTVPVLLSFRPDVVISSEFGFRTLSAALYRAIRPRTKLIVWATISEHSERNRGRRREMLRRFLLRFANGVIVNGRSGARYIANFGFPAKQIHIVPQTGATANFASVSPSRTGPSAKRLLFVGRLIGFKWVPQFLEVLSSWAAKNPEKAVEFLIAGSGPEKSAIQFVPLPPNLSVGFLGDIKYEEMPETYARAGVLVLPSRAEEWGLVVNEAMAAGLPVLGSLYAQAVEDLVVDGENGWVFRPDVPAELTAKLDQVFSTTEEDLNRMRVRARETALRLTPERMADQIFEAIRFTLSPDSGAS